jgi:hypothetical protein
MREYHPIPTLSLGPPPHIAIAPNLRRIPWFIYAEYQLSLVCITLSAYLYYNLILIFVVVAGAKAAD